ncbi:MAG: DUF2231 domain-containing protein [Armatimonadota bacterium]
MSDPIPLWQHVHGASVHFPVALVLFAAVLDTGALLFRKDAWRAAAFWALIAGAVVSIPALLSGLSGQLGWFGIEKWDAESLLRHRNVAFFGTGACVALALWRAIARDQAGTGLRVAWVVLLWVAAGLCGWSGFLGGYVARGY